MARLIRWMILWPIRSALGLVQLAELPARSTLVTSYTMIFYIGAWFLQHPRPTITQVDVIAFWLGPAITFFVFGARWRFPVLMASAVIDITSFYTNCPNWVVQSWWWSLFVWYMYRNVSTRSKLV